MAHRWDPRAPDPGALVRPVRADPRGIDGPTKKQASGRYWRRTSPGHYVPVDTRTDLPEQRIVEQALRLPAGGAVTGWAACRLHGANFFDGLATDGRTPLPVPLNVGPHGNLRADQNVRACHHQLDHVDRAVRFGIPTVTVERAAYDAMRLADDVREAVVALDMMAAARLTSIRRVREYAARCHRRDTRIQEALGLASEHARSPNEVRLRLIWVIDAGLPAPLVNCPVHDPNGRLLGIADLLDVEAGLVVEFDGADHRRGTRQTADVQKEDRLRRVGLEVTRVTGLEIGARSAIVARLLGARARARLVPPSERRWVARPPADDLEQELAEQEFARWQHAHTQQWRAPDLSDPRGL
jgi:hypothetical protein